MKNKTKNQATLKEVAEFAKVSPPTASLVLSGKGNVSEKTRQLVEEAARSLGYKRTSIQKKAIQQQVLSIGLLFNVHTDKSYNLKNFREFLTEAERIITKQNGTFILVPYSDTNSDEGIINTILKTQVKGIISFAYYNERLFRKLEDQSIPVVVFNNQQSHNKFLSVALDDFQATYEAARYLIQKGHRNIIYAYTNRPNIPYLKHNRYFGYRKALEESGIPYDDELILYYSDDAVQKTTESLWKVLEKPQKPTAMVCLDDDIASGIDYLLTQHGYSIPEDLSVIAHGDLLDYSLMQTPRITTMRLNPTTAAQVTTDLLLARLVKGDTDIKTIKIQEHLIERGSCKNLA